MCGRRAGRATQAPNRVLLYKPRSLAELERHDGGRRDAVQLRRAIGNLPPGLARVAFVALFPTFVFKATPPQVRVVQCSRNPAPRRAARNAADFKMSRHDLHTAAAEPCDVNGKRRRQSVRVV